MPGFYFHTWRTQEYDHMDHILRYLATSLVSIFLCIFQADGFCSVSDVMFQWWLENMLLPTASQL